MLSFIPTKPNLMGMGMYDKKKCQEYPLHYDLLMAYRIFTGRLPASFPDGN